VAVDLPARRLDCGCGSTCCTGLRTSKLFLDAHLRPHASFLVTSSNLDFWHALCFFLQAESVLVFFLLTFSLSLHDALSTYLLLFVPLPFTNIDLCFSHSAVIHQLPSFLVYLKQLKASQYQDVLLACIVTSIHIPPRTELNNRPT